MCSVAGIGRRSESSSFSYCDPIYTATPTAHHGSAADGLKEPDTSFPSSDTWFESGHGKVSKIRTAYSVSVEGYSTESWQIASSPQGRLAQAGELGHSRAWDSGVAAGLAAVVLLVSTCLPESRRWCPLPERIPIGPRMEGRERATQWSSMFHVKPAQRARPSLATVNMATPSRTRMGRRHMVRPQREVSETSADNRPTNRHPSASTNAPLT
ncbi:UNVERIFIED_ORG: hypothetical protein J3D58_002937 [Paenarthrobacter nicotinovorans]